MDFESSDFEQRLHRFLQERKEGDICIAYQDMRQNEQEILVPVVQFVGDRHHCMMVLDEDFVTFKLASVGPSFVKDYCGTWKELPYHVKHVAKEEFRFYSRMELVSVR